MSAPLPTTLLEVVQTVSAYATTDEEIVATVAFLINSRKILLCGTFAGARIDLSPDASPAPRPFSARLNRIRNARVQEQGRHSTS
jgi:hypothetical protein